MPGLGDAQWKGERGRTEVWYLTCTDAATGLGVWVHHETVAPTAGQGEPYAHGWTALFEPDEAPRVERFGPGTAVRGNGWHDVAGCAIGDGFARGSAGGLAWDLRFADASPPLFTFPELVWRRHLLPAAQIVPWPAAHFTGSVSSAGVSTPVEGRGAVARIYGHGNAQRWGWLHADLPDGGVLEIVTATARRKAMRRLPPLALVQLRRPGRRDWPRNPLLSAPLLTTDLRTDGFSVCARQGDFSVDVDIPSEAAVRLGYTDPDGAAATCTNSERASATIRHGGRTWILDGTAHAEVGRRP